MGLDEFLQSFFANLITYRDNSKLFTTTDDFLFVDYCLKNLYSSKSQILQDLFVLFYFQEKPNGFFVEFGAANGIGNSNTYLLEKSFQWNGILAEPAKCWQQALRKNRNCMIDTRCLWDKTGEEIAFKEVSKIPELSTINVFSQKDIHAEARTAGEIYQVQTISLNDLLAEYNAPKIIDYLSIDTEGSELNILSAFDFSKYDVRVITVEHNFTIDREKIHALLVKNGYQRTFAKFSLMDDWYIRSKRAGAT